MKFWSTTAVVAAALAVTFAGAPASAQTDAAIRQKIIRASIADYPGSCPCPYNSDRAGRRCGGRSAYNRGGGYAPKCFPSDISAAEVKAQRGGR